MCTVYGAPLGSTDPSDPKGTEYNQVINGRGLHPGRVRDDKLGDGKGCALGEARVQSLAGGASSPSWSSSLAATVARRQARLAWSGSVGIRA